MEGTVIMLLTTEQDGHGSLIVYHWPLMDELDVRSDRVQQGNWVDGSLLQMYRGLCVCVLVTSVGVTAAK